MHKGYSYNIQQLERERESNSNLSKNKTEALKKVEKKRKAMEDALNPPPPTICKGFFGLPCKKQTYSCGLCTTHYIKFKYLEPANEIFGQVMRIQNMNTSSANFLYYGNIKCSHCDMRKALISYPYCESCLSSEHGLLVANSTIPGAGLGLFATKNFKRNTLLRLYYSGDEMNAEQYRQLSIEAETNPIALARFEYILQIGPNTFVDASSQKGGPLRFINEPIDRSKTNAEFHRLPNGHCTVKILREVKAGEELYLIYKQKTRGLEIPSTYSLPASITKSYLLQAKDNIASLLERMD